MYEQTNNQKNALVDMLAQTAYLSARTLYLIKVFGPLYGKRVWHALQTLTHDLGIAREIYGGNNVRFVVIDAPAAPINNYHTRYEGTEREAK